MKACNFRMHRGTTKHFTQRRKGAQSKKSKIKSKNIGQLETS